MELPNPLDCMKTAALRPAAKAPAGDADGLFLPGGGYHVEIGVVLQQRGDPVYADVGNEGYEGYFFLLKLFKYGLGPVRHVCIFSEIFGVGSGLGARGYALDVVGLGFIHGLGVHGDQLFTLFDGPLPGLVEAGDRALESGHDVAGQ